MTSELAETVALLSSAPDRYQSVVLTVRETTHLAKLYALLRSQGKLREEDATGRGVPDVTESRTRLWTTTAGSSRWQTTAWSDDARVGDVAGIRTPDGCWRRDAVEGAFEEADDEGYEVTAAFLVEPAPLLGMTRIERIEPGSVLGRETYGVEASRARRQTSPFVLFEWAERWLFDVDRERGVLLSLAGATARGEQLQSMVVEDIAFDIPFADDVFDPAQ